MVENLDIQKPRTVDVGAIDRELRRMWKEAASDKAHSVVRARILNLVVFTPEAQAAGAADVAAEIAVHHPSRGIIVGIDPAAPDVMTAEVSARCHLSFARRQQVCSEQVLIGAGGKAVDEVHGVVLPLLTSDLPTFLWWRGPGWPESRSFKTLAAGSDRVVLDSSVFVTGASDLARLENLVHEYTKAVADEHSIADLNWARLMPWRVALAGLYDVQHYRERLGHLNRVTLRYPVTAEKRKKADAVEPFLLAGWLAGRLGWKNPRLAESAPKSRDGDGIFFDLESPSGNLQLLLIPSSVAAPAAVSSIELDNSFSCGGVCRIDLNCQSERETTFTVEIRESCIETRAVVDGQTLAARRVSCVARAEADLVSEEMDYLGRDSVYEQAVATAVLISQSVSWGS